MDVLVRSELFFKRLKDGSLPNIVWKDLETFCRASNES